MFSEMINPADNPVGALFERYQTSGAPMPEIEVTSQIDQSFPDPQVNMVAGQAHAPIFKAKLSVCEGLVVTATGSSKKIAKNLAAAEMLQKLMNNSSPQLKSLKQEAIDQREEERRGGGEILHQLVSVGRDKVAELGGMTFLEKLAKEQNFELTVIEVEAVEERVEVLAQVWHTLTASHLYCTILANYHAQYLPNVINSRWSKSREAQLPQ